MRAAELHGTAGSLLDARDIVFSGTSCIGGAASALVFATGMQTELGRIAALTERVEVEPSPLERQVRRVAWLIALVAVVAGLAFLPIGWLVAGLPLHDALSFARSRSAWRGSLVRGPSSSAECGRDARLDDDHLHRQDRDADRESDAGGADLDTAR